jgi:hypothetical protein
MRLRERLKPLLALVLAAVAISAASWGSSQPERVDLRPVDTPIPITLFGLHIHHLFRGAPQGTVWPTVPFADWRLWDAYVTWPDLEPEKGKWNFGMLDKYVDLAEQHHVQILLTLGLTPPWVSSRPEERSNYGPGRAAMPKNITDWQNYVRTVATRYKGRIHEYEIWNEAPGTHFFTGTINQMVQLACVANKTLKQVDPTITVTTPAATGSYRMDWLNEYLKAGGGRCADVIADHLYTNPGPPELIVPIAQQVEQIMRENGVGDKPLWDTETGFAIQDNQGKVTPSPGKGFNSVVLSENQAAGYIARVYILAWAAGVSRLYWFAWDNWIMGLVERDGKTPKPPAIAYGQVEDWLVGARMTSCDSDAKGTWTCRIGRPGGYVGLIMWNPDRTFRFDIPESWGVRDYRNLSGSESKLAGKASVLVSPSPILLEQQLGK